MPVRTRKDLEQALKQGRIEPVYFLYGSEVYLRDQAIRLITDTALTGTLLREFNDSSFNLLTNDVRDAIAAAEQLPMMSDRRVIRLRNFGKLREADEEFLLAYLERPVETSVVIFIDDDIDKRKKFGKKLLAGAAFEFQALRLNELTLWVKRSREHMNWDLTDSIVSRDRRTALRVLREFLDDGAEPVLLTGVIAGTLRRMALAKELLARGSSPGEIFSEVRVPSFTQRAYH